MSLTTSQYKVWCVLFRLDEKKDGIGEGGAELSNEMIADRAGLSKGWTSETLRALEKMGHASSRQAPSVSDPATRWRLWRIRK